MILIDSPNDVRRISRRRRGDRTDSERRRKGSAPPKGPARCPLCDNRRSILANSADEVGTQEWVECPRCRPQTP